MLESRGADLNFNMDVVFVNKGRCDGGWSDVEKAKLRGGGSECRLVVVGRWNQSKAK
jgi:hypothetical protein